MATHEAPAKRFSREYLAQQRNSGRLMILLTLVFTLLNMVLLLCGTEKYFLFSADIPHFLTYYGMQMDGGSFGVYTVGMLIVALCFLTGYVLSWLFVNKNGGWLKVALILFVMDTLALMGLTIGMNMFEARIMDIAIHALILWDLVQAMRADKRLQKLPPEEPAKKEA